MAFIHDDFMLSTGAARQLYHSHAEGLPIIDYHCHLSPRLIAEDVRFEDITQLWLVDKGAGDHYKWRAMRAAGVGEEYITGSRSGGWETFRRWAETVPCTMRNPLYHWTHLELSRVFGIDKLLSPATARDIYEECNALLASPEFSGQNLIRKFNVETLCTTDDPVDDLRYHKDIAARPFGVKVLPAWRPDKLFSLDDKSAFRSYVESLGQAAGMTISTYDELLEALQRRHDYFAAAGCRLSDHGMDTFYAAECKPSQVEAGFASMMAGRILSPEQADALRSALLHDLAVMDFKAGWAQQFHIGPIRNNNPRMFRTAGPDTGFDAINDNNFAAAGHRFFGRLADEECLARTILYCLNPKDNVMLAAMASTFNDGTVPGKMQFGAAWWFLDQEFGMREQLDVLSSQGLLSRFVGMLTDSRSFISYPRHEYFRRILCDVLGSDIESGRLPESEMDFIGKMVEDISCNNARNYFGF